MKKGLTEQGSKTSGKKEELKQTTSSKNSADNTGPPSAKKQKTDPGMCVCVCAHGWDSFLNTLYYIECSSLGCMHECTYIQWHVLARQSTYGN